MPWVVQAIIVVPSTAHPASRAGGTWPLEEFRNSSSTGRTRPVLIARGVRSSSRIWWLSCAKSSCTSDMDRVLPRDGQIDVFEARRPDLEPGQPDARPIGPRDQLREHRDDLIGLQ